MKLTEILMKDNIENLLSELDVKAPLLSYDIKNYLGEIDKGENTKDNIKKICYSFIVEFLKNENVYLLFDYTKEEIDEIRVVWDDDLYSFLNMVTEKNIANITPKELTLDEKIDNLVEFITKNTLFVLTEKTQNVIRFSIDDDLFDYNQKDNLVAEIENQLPNSETNFVEDDGQIKIFVDIYKKEEVVSFGGIDLINCEVSILTETNEIFTGLVTYVANSVIEGVLEIGSEIASKNVSVNIMCEDGIPYRGIIVEVITIN